MKPCVFFLLVTLVFCASCGRQEEKDVQAYLDAAFRLYRERNEDTAAIAEVLNQGLAAYPDSVALLQSRGNLHCSRGMLRECRADTIRLLELKPDMAEARMMLCMLDEFEGADAKTCEACYLEAAALFAARSPASSPELETMNKANYVFTLLLARHPDAEKEKAAFLSKVASEPDAWIHQLMFENFDRERFLGEVFGEDRQARGKRKEE